MAVHFKLFNLGMLTKQLARMSTMVLKSHRNHFGGDFTLLLGWENAYLGGQSGTASSCGGNPVV